MRAKATASMSKAPAGERITHLANGRQHDVCEVQGPLAAGGGTWQRKGCRLRGYTVKPTAPLHSREWRYGDVEHNWNMQANTVNACAPLMGVVMRVMLFVLYVP